MHRLPPFPVDDGTLDLLMAAIDPRSHGDPQAERSNVGSFLEFMSQLGGSDTKAVQEPGEHVDLMRDQHYSHHDVMCALVEEVRRLRAKAEA